MKGGRRCTGVDDGVGIGGGRWRGLRKEDEDGGWLEVGWRIGGGWFLVGGGWVEDWFRKRKRQRIEREDSLGGTP